MNKKLIALALVLLIAVGGLFAASDLPVASPVLALLKGTIGNSFSHGFLIGDSTEYESGKTIPGDAFDAPAVLKYGFTAKHSSAFKTQVKVTAFSNGNGGTVNIAKVTVAVGGSNPQDTTWTGATEGIDVLEYATSDLNKTVTAYALITITPGSLEEKPVGEYTSTVTVDVTTAS